MKSLPSANSGTPYDNNRRGALRRSPTATLSKMASPRNNGKRHETAPLSQRSCWRIVAQPTAFTHESIRTLIRRGCSYYGSPTDLDKEQLSRDVSTFGLEALNSPEVDLAEAGSPFDGSNPCRLALVAGLAAVLAKRQELFRRDPRTCIVQRHIHSQLKEYIVAASREAAYNRAIRTEMGRVAYLLFEYQNTETASLDQPIELTTLEDGREEVHYKVHKNATRVGSQLSDQAEGTLPITRSTEDYVYIRGSDVERRYAYYWEDRRGRAPGNRLESAIKTVFPGWQLEGMGQALSKLRAEMESLAHHGMDERLFQPLSVSPEVKLLIRAVDYGSTLSFGAPLSALEIAKATTRYRQQTEQTWPKNYAATVASTAKAQGRLQQLADDEDCPQVESAENLGLESAGYIIYPNEGAYRMLEVGSPEEMLEIPCIRNLDRNLLESKESRGALDDLVQLMTTVVPPIPSKKIVDWIVRYPWLSRSEAEAVVDRFDRPPEGEQGMFSCRREPEHLDQFCVGFGQCEYSLSRSLRSHTDSLR